MSSETREIIGETIKTALAVEILKALPGIMIYRERMTGPLVFPHIYLEQLTLDADEDRKDHYFLSYFLTLRYRHVADINAPSAPVNLQAILDGVSLSLLTGLKNLNFGALARIRNANTEKVDGVLHYFCNVRIQVTKEKIEQIKQMYLTRNITSREE